MLGGLATSRRCSLLQPPSVGQAGNLLHTIRGTFNRAITAREKVKSRLIGDLNPRDWELPPKPKWMRWRTYDRLAEKYCLQQGKIDQIILDYAG